MPGMDFNLARIVRRLLPATLPQDGTFDPLAPRGSGYGEMGVLSPVPTKHLLADEGSYFIATNPAPGTGIAGPIVAAFADTTPFIYFQNNDKNRNLFIDYIKLIVTVVPATAAQAYFAFIADQVSRALTTDNTAASAANSANSGVAAGSNIQIKVQNTAVASVIAASSASKRIVARGAFGGIPVVGDELVATFGSADPGAYAGLTAAQAACPGRKVSNCAPVILAPGHSGVFHLWFPGNATTGISFEYEVGVVLR